MTLWNLAAVAATLALAAAGAAAGEPEPALEPVPVEAFAVADRIRAPRLSPDGRHVAVAVNFGDGHHGIAVHRVADMAQVGVLRLPRYELAAQLHWVSDRRLLVAKGRFIGAREKPWLLGELIATDYDGSNQTYVYGYRKSTRRAGIDPGFGYIEGLPAVPNGRFYMRRLSGSSSRSMLYDVDAGTTNHRLVADIGVPDLGFVLDRAGQARFAIGRDRDDKHLLYEAGESGRDWTPVPASRTGGTFTPFAFSQDGGRVFAAHSVDDGPVALVSSDPGGNARTVLAGDSFGNVGGVEWNAAREPFAATLMHGKPRMVYFDEGSADASEHRMLGGLFPGRYVTYANHSADGRVSLLHVFSDRDPGTWYLYDRGQSTATILLASREGIDPARMGERRYFRFKASDGLELDGYLTLPAGVTQPRKLPMVLLPHGGPHAEGDGWGFDTDAQFLASRGYLVLQVNFRGSQGRGYRFERAGFRNWGTRIQDDLLDGVRWAIAEGHADPGRICAYGASFGAYSAMMAAARAPDLIRCAAGLAGLYDLPAFVSDSDVGSTRDGSAYLSRVLGSDQAALRAASPTTLAARITAPVFLAHGELDERTPHRQALAMKKALEDQGRPPEWMSVPREGHGFHRDENSVEFYRRLEAFLAKHIGDAPRPQP